MAQGTKDLRKSTQGHGRPAEADSGLEVYRAVQLRIFGGSIRAPRLWYTALLFLDIYIRVGYLEQGRMTCPMPMPFLF